ncbi:MAG TPA: uroporphyrinogen decarboxylase [Symbiobacteriaceae bacterium]|nr:uroporphyrinogen decarboxylase [Symbiobacteriaceae bacterium]
MLMNDRILRAARRQPVDHVPVWFMRQAGRYQPEYRAVREKYTLMEICEHPEVCAEVTILPVKQLNVDAAILFSDIMTPLRAMGLGVDIVENVGPVFDRPFRTLKDVQSIPQLNAAEMVPYVLETIKILVRELEVPLLGFAGAPFTLASYMVEGRPTKDYRIVKTLMYSEPETWATLMEKLSDMVAAYLVDQINAGCHAVQLFDSWVGNLNRADYEQYVQPYMYRIVDAVKATGRPLIHFGVHTGHLLESMAATGADVVGVDWKEEIDRAWERIGYNHAVQGNLDPVAVFAPHDVMKAKVHDVLRRTEGRPGHIFNLGHGCMPQMKISDLQRVVEYVHAYDHKEGN